MSISADINFKFKNESSQIFNTGDIFFIKLNISEREYISQGLPDDIIDSFNHFWILLNTNNEDIVYYNISSRFYNFIFNNEFGEIIEFHNNNCNKCHKLKQSEAMRNIRNKYKKSTNTINRDSIFIINKDFYKLNYESIINLSKPNYIKKDILNTILLEKTASIFQSNRLRNRDKDIINTQILHIIKDNKDTVLNKKLNDIIKPLK